MWLETIDDFKKENKQILDFKFELHVAIYVQKLLQNNIDFSINNLQELVIKKESKEITFDQFFYWWQITRFDELISEEEIIFNNFNTLKDKITKAIQNVKNPIIDKNDSDEDKQKKNDKISKNSEKIKKLNEHLKQEANKSNLQINTLKNFRFIYPSHESLKSFTKNIKIIINNKI
tara:strand:- start:135 stop:662 length:528 start_codon:yes stop_codon:yes gene_type:complete